MSNSYIYLNIYILQGTFKNVIYIYIYIYKYICLYLCMYYLIKTCPTGHCHKSFMATGALGHTHLRLHVVGIQDPNTVKVNSS